MEPSHDGFLPMSYVWYLSWFFAFYCIRLAADKLNPQALRLAMIRSCGNNKKL